MQKRIIVMKQARWFPSAQANGQRYYTSLYQSETDIDVLGARVALQKRFNLNGRESGTNLWCGL